ncbi:uncharacterized protein LOC132728732 [Ruditapes philippinarum]|uniref:uncharacterized protein LOC132728732 n=1 Tax=Ruditapes philippinarum TaxID=129788 RepID=UPI00295BF4F5|nr:uncharacterized protein LOC132728732 [Ruditapes philippinarum]
MEDDCTGYIDMESAAIPAGRLSVTRRSKYRSKLKCHVTIKAPLDRRIVVVFREMDIEWEPNCGDDFMSLHDGHNMTARVLRGTHPQICGHIIPPGDYTTTGNLLTVGFQSDGYKQNNGFEIVFTSFHTAESCFVDELRCSNKRCVASSLHCNNFNNCGDDSDECEVDSEVVIAITLSVFLLTVVGVGSILLYRKRKRQLSHRRQQDLKAAIVKASQLSKDLESVEIHPCEACSLEIVSKEKQKLYARKLQENDNEAYQESYDARMHKEVLGTRLTDNFYRASI